MAPFATERVIAGLGLLALCSATACAQQPGVGSTPTVRAEATLVQVPVVVRGPGGELVHGLQARDFHLLDDGSEQKLTLQDTTSEPLAVVVLLQTGGSAPRQFEYYPGLATMLQYALGSVPYRISLVTFDSEPEERWPFSADADNLRQAFQQPREGDHGAAVLDAIAYGLDWFDDQHPRGRRLLLLVSQTEFGSSQAKREAVLQRLTETNTTLYSLNFSPSSTWAKDQFTRERHEAPPWFFAPDHPDIVHTIDVLTPLKQAMSAMQKNATGTLASLSGGASMPFGNKRELEMQLNGFANEVANRYLLSFQPTSGKQGLHRLELSVPGQPALSLSARSGYWRTTPVTKDLEH